MACEDKNAPEAVAAGPSGGAVSFIRLRLRRHCQWNPYTTDFHHSYPMAANGRLSVETFNGSIEVTGWDEPTVDISGTKYARTQQAADDLQVSIDHSANVVPSGWSARA